jgi:hypothetical protein
MEVFVRYEIKDENGETRRDRNERFEHGSSPPVEIPDEARYLWRWFMELSDGTGRFREGLYHPITWADLKAWSDVTGTIVYRVEFDILRAMDDAYCHGMNQHVSERHARDMEQLRRDNKG